MLAQVATPRDEGVGLPQLIVDTRIAGTPCAKWRQRAGEGQASTPSSLQSKRLWLCRQLWYAVFGPLFSLLRVGAYFEASPPL